MLASCTAFISRAFTVSGDMEGRSRPRSDRRIDEAYLSIEFIYEFSNNWKLSEL